MSRASRAIRCDSSDENSRSIEPSGPGCAVRAAREIPAYVIARSADTSARAMAEPAGELVVGDGRTPAVGSGALGGPGR